MRGVGAFLSLCLALAVARAAVSALMIVFLIALIWAVCRYPREVVAFFVYCTTLNLISAYPLASLLVIGVVVISSQFGNEAN